MAEVRCGRQESPAGWRGKRYGLRKRRLEPSLISIMAVGREDVHINLCVENFVNHTMLIHQPTLSRNSSNDSSGNISMPSPRLIWSLASSTRAKNSFRVRSVGSFCFSDTSLRRYLATRFSILSSSARAPRLRSISAFSCTAVITAIIGFCLQS